MKMYLICWSYDGNFVKPIALFKSKEKAMAELEFMESDSFIIKEVTVMDEEE